ncbi:hypothetical protein ACO2Q8_09140 [Larkinella sp. VNQ87]|uniref:hypothetical protein n=1 Tax=Larkinella sp. VNQ87 TaxID=3400921 RepID=UPI003C07BFFB
MSHKESRETPYPPAFSHLEEKVRQAKEQIGQLENLIETTPKDKTGPSLGLNPPGFLRSRPLGSHDQRVAALKGQIEQIRKDAFGQIEKETSQADPKTARLVREHALSYLYPNPVKEMSPDKKETFRQSPKDLEQSQEMMDAILSDYQEKKQQVPEKEQGSTQASLSQKFMATFHFNRSEMTDKSPSKDADRDKERD